MLLTLIDKSLLINLIKDEIYFSNFFFQVE